MNNPPRSKRGGDSGSQTNQGAGPPKAGAKSPASHSAQTQQPSGRNSNEGLEYVVRFGSMRSLGAMKSTRVYRYGDEVVARTSRGTEVGTVLCEATPSAIDSIEEPTAGRIVRLLSDDDRTQSNHLNLLTKDDIAASQLIIDSLELSMELVDVERILGGEKMIFYFLAEQRVDFRQLVRDLAKHFQTRIEMRQIGVRDEAKLLADYGDCGQPICCATFLSKMPPVSMRMAKLQKATLDPAKISGRCGRLKCCLRYEFDTYESTAKELPPPGSIVLTRDGNATILGRNLLAGQMTVRTDDDRRILIGADDIVSVIKRGEDPTKPRRTRKGGSNK